MPLPAGYIHSAEVVGARSVLVWNAPYSKTGKRDYLEHRQTAERPPCSNHTKKECSINSARTRSRCCRRCRRGKRWASSKIAL